MMIGTLPLVGSSVLTSSPTCSCFYADVPCAGGMKNGVELVSSRNWVGRKQFKQTGWLEVSNTYVELGRARCVACRSCSRKKRKAGGLVIVSELAGQYDDSFGDVRTHILNYFTYKAVRTVLNQLYEMNPTQYRWFYNYVATNKPAEGKIFIRNLVKEKQELAERVMITRLHLYGQWIKKCNHAEIYEEIYEENLELMRERLIETIIWPTDDTNTERIG